MDFYVSLLQTCTKCDSFAQQECMKLGDFNTEYKAINTEQDKGILTGMVFLDLQKAFDTVDQNILLQKQEDFQTDNPSI